MENLEWVCLAYEDKNNSKMPKNVQVLCVNGVHLIALSQSFIFYCVNKFLSQPTCVLKGECLYLLNKNRIEKAKKKENKLQFSLH